MTESGTTMLSNTDNRTLDPSKPYHLAKAGNIAPKPMSSGMVWVYDKLSMLLSGGLRFLTFIKAIKHYEIDDDGMYLSSLLSAYSIEKDTPTPAFAWWKERNDDYGRYQAEIEGSEQDEKNCGESIYFIKMGQMIILMER